MFFCLAALLLVKEDLGLLVSFFGIYLTLLRHWKRGLACMGLGLGGFFLCTMVIAPWMAGSQYYPLWFFTDLGKNLPDSVQNVFHHPFLVLQVWFSNSEKILTMLFSFLACSFMILLSPLAVLPIEIFAERMLSCREGLWSMSYHYSATIAPILFMGGVDGLFRLGRFLKNENVSKKSIQWATWFTVVMNFITVFIFPTRDLFRAKFYRPSPVIATGRHVLSLIPGEATVVAQDTIVPHLSNRMNIYMIENDTMKMECDYYVACRNLNSWPLESYEPIENNIHQRLEQGYSKIFEGDGWTLLKKAPASQAK